MSGTAPRTAIVVAPAVLGSGGLGQSAAEVVAGLGEHGFEVTFAGGSVTPTRLRRIAARRPLRRLARLGRELDRRDVLSGVDGSYGVAYAMPGFLAPGLGEVRVLHLGTRHPLAVQSAVEAAKRAAGGGRGFMTAREARALTAELEGADLVRVLCQPVRDELVAAGVSPERVVLAYPGVDLTRFRPGVKGEQPEIAFVGALSLWKGVDIVAELARRLGDRARVTVAGGPACPWSRRVVAAASFERDQDVPRLLARSHFLVLPSTGEGFGRVVLEAMASGCIPIVSPEVGASEIVRRLEPALVVPRGDFDRRAAELITTLSHSQLAPRARAIAEGFDRPAMARAAGAALVEGVDRLGSQGRIAA